MNAPVSNTGDLIAVVDAVIGALREHAIPYYITGSFASSVHGEFRATNDIDLVSPIAPRNPPPQQMVFP